MPVKKFHGVSFMFMSVFWAVLAGAALVAELLTGTMYLLVFGASAAAACVLAFTTDASSAGQFALFSLLCLPGVAGLRMRKVKELPTVMASDIGATVEVLAVREDGTFRVRHSGTDWDAVLVEPATTDDTPKWLVIVGTQGNLLKCKLAPAK
jgi:membrane protein implicated in regulation of membrane protease activity